MQKTIACPNEMNETLKEGKKKLSYWKLDFSPSDKMSLIKNVGQQKCTVHRIDLQLKCVPN